MYPLKQYVHQGASFGGAYFLGWRRLATLMLYVTNRCNSRCQTCYIWSQKPKYDLSPRVVEEVLRSKAITRATHIGIEGGEAILHPQVDKILEIVRGRNVTFFSSGIMPRRLERLVVTHGIRSVYLSLDGAPDTYSECRGVDGYHRVLEAIDRVRPHARVALQYTASRWNSQDDLEHVRQVCLEKGLDLKIGVYHQMPFFDSKESPLPLQYEVEPADFRPFSTPLPYLTHYNDWLTGKLVLPCLSIRHQAVVLPNGDVPLCQSKAVILGNVYEDSFDRIWNRRQTLELQRENRGCNGCWTAFHRIFDLTLVRGARRLLPDPAVRRLFGEFQLPE